MYWDIGTGSNVFTQLASSTNNLTLWTKDNSNMPLLVPGVYYQFKVSAVNLIGESDQSPAAKIIAATYPDAPSLPTKVNAGKNFVQIAWVANYDGGSPILDF